MLLFLLIIGIALWLTGVALVIFGGLPILLAIGKFMLEAYVGYKVWTIVKKKKEERQQSELNRIKGL